MNSACQDAADSKGQCPCKIPRLLLAFSLMALCLASFLADDAVAAFFAGLRSPSLNTLAGTLNCIGDWPAHTLFGLLAAGVAWRLRRKDVTRLFLAMILASSLAGVTVNVVRCTTGRPRPLTKAQDGFYGMRKDGKWIGFENRYQSFPSAHTATAVAFSGVVLFAGIRGGWLIALFGPLVGCARIYSRAHHFSDVVTATCIGLLFSWWAWRFVQRRWRKDQAACGITASPPSYPP